MVKTVNTPAVNNVITRLVIDLMEFVSLFVKVGTTDKNVTKVMYLYLNIDQKVIYYIFITNIFFFDLHTCLLSICKHVIIFNISIFFKNIRQPALYIIFWVYWSISHCMLDYCYGCWDIPDTVVYVIWIRICDSNLILH